MGAGMFSIYLKLQLFAERASDFPLMRFFLTRPQFFLMSNN